MIKSADLSICNNHSMNPKRKSWHLKRKRETLKNVMKEDPKKAHFYERVLKHYDERIREIEEHMRYNYLP